MNQVYQALEIGKELKLPNYKLAELIGLAPNAFSAWTSGNRNPSERSLGKVNKFINAYEAGTLDLPKPKQQPTITKKITDPKVKVMYELIYKLEDKYGGSLSNVPEDDPVLQILRKEVGVI
jgi:transcriptional regulator with XRE-family HTH domain